MAVLPPRPGRAQAGAAVQPTPSGWWHPDPGRTCRCKRRGCHAKQDPAVACELASLTEQWRLEVARVWPCPRRAGPLILDDPGVPARYCVCGCDHCPGRGSHCLSHAAGCHLLGGCTFTLGAAGCREITLAERMAAHRTRNSSSTPVTSQNTPDPGRVGGTTTAEEDAMPSHATKAAQATATDRAKLTLAASDGKTVGKTPSKGDLARRAARDALPEWQQAEYDRLVEAGTRHVTALAKARMVPEPAPEPTELDKDVANLFAAFKAGQVGAAGPAESLTAAVQAQQPKPKPEPAKAKAKPEPAAKPKPAPVPVAGPGTLPAQQENTRYVGTVTATDLEENTRTYKCEHASRNGHMDVATALACARRLLRNHPGVPGVDVHPVKRDRNGKRVSA